MYQKLDELIVENISRSGAATLIAATCGKAGIEAERISELTGRESFRVLDGRLQALRKKGLIRHDGKFWRIDEGA